MEPAQGTEAFAADEWIRIVCKEQERLDGFTDLDPTRR
jgi:hypothetical protein